MKKISLDSMNLESLELFLTSEISLNWDYKSNLITASEFKKTIEDTVSTYYDVYFSCDKETNEFGLYVLDKRWTHIKTGYVYTSGTKPYEIPFPDGNDHYIYASFEGLNQTLRKNSGIKVPERLFKKAFSKAKKLMLDFGLNDNGKNERYFWEVVWSLESQIESQNYKTTLNQLIDIYDEYVKSVYGDVKKKYLKKDLILANFAGDFFFSLFEEKEFLMNTNKYYEKLLLKYLDV